VVEPLRRSMRVRCPIEHAFLAFTDRIDQWWPPGHRRFEGSRLFLEAVAGGRFFERSPGGEEARTRKLGWGSRPASHEATLKRKRNSKRLNRNHGDRTRSSEHARRGSSGRGDEPSCISHDPAESPYAPHHLCG
jgi:hypothetical protein